jgi:hypothetical protein
VTSHKKTLWYSWLKQAQTHRVPQKQWPKRPDLEFERMSGELRRAVESAVRNATKDAEIDDWKWDVYTQTFTFVVGMLVDIGDTNASVTLRMAFNPKVAWLDEIERVMIEAEKHVREIRTKLEKKR